MGKQQKSKVGGNKAKGRRSAKNKAMAKYVKRQIITERNRLRKRVKHLKKHPGDKQTAKLVVV